MTLTIRLLMSGVDKGRLLTGGKEILPQLPKWGKPLFGPVATGKLVVCTGSAERRFVDIEDAGENRAL